MTPLVMPVLVYQRERKPDKITMRKRFKKTPNIGSSGGAV